MRFRFFTTRLIRLAITFAFTVNILGINSLLPVQAQGNKQVRLEQLDLLTTTQGWVLVGQRLFWTSDAGQTWNEIGPSVPSEAVIQDVEFIELNRGWVLWTTAASDSEIGYHLAQTIDNGTTWTTHTLSLFAPGEIPSNAEKAEMGWFDAQSGWISVKQNSGSNFSLGTLFTTSNGGESWSRFTLPVAEDVYFSDPQTGWATGGSANDQIFHTQDGGASWKTVQPASIPERTQAIAYPPVHSNGQGLLVMTHLGVEDSLNVYALESSFDGWQPVGQVALDVQPGVMGLSILDPQNFVAVIPGTTSIARMSDGQLAMLDNADGLSASIVELDMVSLDVGWARSIDSSCATDSLSTPGPASISCSSITSLLQTTDGGITWQRLELPGVPSASISSSESTTNDTITMSAAAATENTEIFTGQGFDRCQIPTLSQMQTWWNSSPYKTVNLYIGGSSRTCANNVLSSSYLFQLNQQGWKFFPTWVGPQAPCTGYPNRMSSDVTTAYQQGVTQANAAVERLAELGLTGPSKTGSVVYYDIEPYGTDSTCRAAVNAFMNGWVSQIHARGSLAGVYGSTLCDTGLSDFLNITNVPDVIWPARWYHSLGAGYYDPSANVWNLGSCIPNNMWANHQRIRQYEGDHNETWGSLTLDIDSNVLDGVVAIPYDYPHVSSITRMDTNPSNASTVRFAVSFSKSVTGVNRADFALTTSGITGASITSVSGSGNTYTVTVDAGSGDGTIRLDVVDNDRIEDGAGNPLGGSGAGNGNFNSGEVYTITRTTFGDVPTNHLFYPYIEAFYDAGITAGCSQSPKLYCPENPVTRGEMAVFIERAMGNFSPNPSSTGMFTDVLAGDPFKPFIEELYNDGITGGCNLSPLMYCPQSHVTRGQMAVFIERAMGNFSPNPFPTGMFTDVLAGDPFKPFIEELYNDGITGGCNLSPLQYCPQSYVTRGQMAVFIVRAFGIPLP